MIGLSLMGLMAQMSYLIYGNVMPALHSIEYTNTWDPSGLTDIGRRGWNAEAQVCDLSSIKNTARQATVYLSVDVFLLTSMVIGLRLRSSARQFSLWQILWVRGWVWMAIATLSGIPAVVRSIIVYRLQTLVPKLGHCC